MIMKRILLASVGCVALSAPAAFACPFHGEDFGQFSYDEADETSPSINWEPSPEALAAEAAAREQAMQTARASFLTRFGVKVEEARAASEQPKLLQASLTSDSDADRRSRTLAQDR